ncbi:pimeloyl-ACP methyl ester carboxylesterase [Rarobacter faecitabidus]|uniref:Pimeloyl-ACP methyl ester carboxylesterase n=1 Tax=Rarobacter faecitabidus TaxID=13243 RepID=A0A542ZP29_RARFA|nr:pimeloyl-ACP methyl ester carboxylesterase [Rarobacter faecitabidus]
MRRFGRPAGQPTVLWSSMFVDSHTWDRILPLLLDASPERLYLLIDPPGLGRSEELRGRTGIADAAVAAREALEALGIRTPVDWVGNAFGGHVGYELAVSPGVLRSLVSISAPVEPITPAMRRQIRLLAPLLRSFGAVGAVRSAVIKAMLTDESAANGEIRRIVFESLARPTKASMSRALQSFILDRGDVSALLPTIAVPSLYLTGDDRGDWSPACASRAASRTPAATAAAIPGSRTLVPLEQPQATARELLAFWQGL